MALGGVLGALTDNFVIEQITAMNVTAPIVSTAIGPFLVELSNTVNAAAPNVPLSPAELAVAVIRTALTEDQGATEARSSGMSPGRFHTLLEITGNPPAPVELAIALRRKFISEADYTLGIARGDLRNEYAGLVRQLATQQASPAEVLTAVVEGQLDPAVGRDMFTAVGGDPSDFDWRLGTVGSAPSPVEAYAFAAKGVIPWSGTGENVVSFEQAIKEGHSRNKWLAVYRDALAPIPPPRTIVAMLRDGAFTEAQADTELAKHGITPELRAAYLRSAVTVAHTKAKELAESTVLTLYNERIIDRGQAAAMIELLGYSAAEAEYILSAHDFAAEAAALKAAVSRVHTLFVGHKLDAATAGIILGELQVPADRSKALLEIWATERAANVRILTEAQTVSAWGNAIIDTSTATADLVALGYSKDDSLTLLAIHNKGPLSEAQISGNVDSKS